MEIIKSTLPAKLRNNIDLLSPFEGHNTVEFTLKAQGDCTLVSHAMFGSSPYISKLMGLFFSMDKMIGEKFQEGLSKLKAVGEV
jgi:hypothetical protein